MRSSKLATFAIASCLATGTAAFAQTATPPGPPFAFVSVTTVTVKPSAVSDFEEYARKINAAAVKAGVRPNNFYSVGRGGPGFTYVATLRFTKWAELDERPSLPSMLKKAYGDAEGAKIYSAGSASIASASSVVLRVLPGASSPPASLDTPAAHVRVSRIEINQGMGVKFEAYLGKLKAAQDKAGGTPPVIRYATALGPANSYSSAYFFDKFAQWDGAPAIADLLRKHYGEGEAAILEETSRSCIKGLESYVLDYRADLSKP
jgi:hypothetical protein